MNNYLVMLLIWNVVVMLVYGIDKLKAKKGKRRISEPTLLLIAFILGGLGANFGMIMFNLKTSKIKFRLLIPIAVIIEVALIYFILK